MTADLTTQIGKYTHVFLDQLGVTASLKVKLDSQNDLYQINLTADKPDILIGHHGDTLYSLQIILAQHLKIETGQWLNISLNVNDYRQRREEALHTLADSVADQVIATNRPHTLTPLPANERRIIHLRLSDHPKVTTESVGEGRSRTIVISSKV